MGFHFRIAFIQLMQREPVPDAYRRYKLHLLKEFFRKYKFCRSNKMGNFALRLMASNAKSVLLGGEQGVGFSTAFQ